MLRGGLFHREQAAFAHRPIVAAQICYFAGGGKFAFTECFWFLDNRADHEHSSIPCRPFIRRYAP
jgi:hypothetical protein